MESVPRLLPEWVSQEAILLSWPDAKTDWADWLEEVQETYISLINKINTYSCPVILLARPDQIAQLQERLHPSAKVLLVPADYNDTWIRDYGFLTCDLGGHRYPVSYTFNGWGNKFDASKDNRVNCAYLADMCRKQITEYGLVLEGGALEINADGILLSTALCLSNPERNGEIRLSDYEKQFAEQLGARKTLILQNGHLEGDDTDGHIDTLVRFTHKNNLVIQSAFNRPEDSHFAGLAALVEECRTALPECEIFELPLPEIFNEDGDRLPASYANYLLSNKHVFAPIYGEPEDRLAIQTLEKAYPDYKVVPIDCRALIQQYGSLHCISMQVPTNTLKPEIIEQLHLGVSVYE
ncbi:agmatine deiminase family protein [Planctobacterium marinum]|uniref:Agmatine deiminase n=1 Tax=Planctobacterium marinum TaxID=1631968 RepID=A0AA48KN53_9ALTE|nr:hypothetical protein MACH26_06670 [Planctobacterium marinum]